MTAREEFAERFCAWLQCSIWGHRWRETTQLDRKWSNVFDVVDCARCQKEKTRTFRKKANE